jgi:hypothetical protein
MAELWTRLRRTANWPLAAYLLAILLVTVQKGLITRDVGNYMLFRDSFYRLISGGDIYNPPPGEIAGFLYSPTFALLFAPFAIWPVPLGLLLWNGVNALAVYYGLTRVLPSRAAQLALAIVFLDVVRSLQNSQSNALVAGLILIAFVALERKGGRGGETMAAAAVFTGAFIKIFPLAAGVFGLLGPPERRFRFLSWSVVIGLALAALPLLVLPPAAVAAVYRGWYGILQRDTGLQGQSVMRILSDWFGSAAPNWTIQLTGALLLLLPVALRRDLWADGGFRRLFLSSLLVFVVIFNHQAESPSFVLATCGIAIWYVSSRREWWRTALLAFTLFAVAVPRLFFFPYQISQDVIKSHALDAFSCLLVWLVMQVELWTWPRSQLAEVTQRDVPSGEAGLYPS